MRDALGGLGQASASVRFVVRVSGCTDPGSPNYNPAANGNAGCVYNRPPVVLEVTWSPSVPNVVSTVTLAVDTEDPDGDVLRCRAPRLRTAQQTPAS